MHAFWLVLRRRLPHLPGSIPTRVEILQLLLFLERVHARPKPVVLVADEAVLSDQPLEGFYDQFFSVAKVLKDVFAESEISAIDPQTCVGNMLDTADQVACQRNHVKALRGPHAN